jgi:hypothetical protein
MPGGLKGHNHVRDEAPTVDPNYRTPDGETWKEFASRLRRAGESAFSSARNRYWRERERHGLTTWAQCTEKAVAEFPASKYPALPDGGRATRALALLPEREAASFDDRNAGDTIDLADWLLDNLRDLRATPATAPSLRAWTLLTMLRDEEAMARRYVETYLDRMTRTPTGTDDDGRPPDGLEKPLADTIGLEAMIDSHA